MKLLRSTAIFSAMTLLSRIAGYARDLVQAQVFGASMAMDAFLIAYRIPNFLRRIFAEGSFAQAFVPVFSQTRNDEDREKLRDLLDHVAGALFAVVLLVTGLGILLAPAITTVFAPGTLDEPEKFALTSTMLQITFPYLFFISLTALAGGVLNSFNRFAIPALTPVLHNVMVICAALWLAPRMDQPILALAWGVFAAGVVQLLVQWPGLKRLGLVPRMRFDLAHQGVRRIFKLMLPTILGSSVAQINLLVGTLFASLLVTGSQTWLYLSDRLLEFPLGMFGVALGTVILPNLSRQFAAGDTQSFSRTLDWGLRIAILMGVPAAVGLILLAAPLNAALYQYGAYTAFDTKMGALSLAAMSIGLPGFMLAKVLAPSFYARQDTRTPVRAAIITLIVNVVLTVAIVGPMWWWKVEGAHAGIALATGLSGLLNAGLLWIYLRRSGAYQASAGWWGFLLRVMFASLFMAATLWWINANVDVWQNGQALNKLGYLFLAVVAGMLVYGTTLLLFGLRLRHLREAN